jgi:multiple sugar transport system permease protein
VTTSTRPSARAQGRFSRRMGDVGVVALMVFALFPIAWTCYTSFRPEQDIITDPTSLIPAALTLDNYVATWRQTDFPQLMLNSLVVSVMTVVISLTLATFAAYSLSRSRFRGRGAVLMLYLGIRIIPGVLLLIPLFIVMQQLGLLDTRVALALTYTTFTLPAAVWFMKGFFDGLPVDLENAARVDGCTRLGALFRVVLPLVRPGLAATAILVAIEAWNEVLFALLLTSTTESRTWPVGMRLLIGEFQLPWGQLTAAAVLSLLPVVVAFAFAGRAMIAGLTAGGLKE